LMLAVSHEQNSVSSGRRRLGEHEDSFHVPPSTTLRFGYTKTTLASVLSNSHNFCQRDITSILQIDYKWTNTKSIVMPIGESMWSEFGLNNF
jgi:hypothetical protein